MVMERENFQDERGSTDTVQWAQESRENDCRLAFLLARRWILKGSDAVLLGNTVPYFVYGTSWMDPGKAILPQQMERLIEPLKNSVLLTPGDPNARSLNMVISDLAAAAKPPLPQSHAKRSLPL